MSLGSLFPRSRGQARDTALLPVLAWRTRNRGAPKSSYSHGP
jgi:hypothetical protein